MDVYHNVLLKLFEETGGSDSRAVDFADIVKRLKFHANYPTIYKELSVQGWIVETSKADWVKITHWGIMEAKKSQSGEGGNLQDLKKDSNRILSEARELLGLLENLVEDVTGENIAIIEKKISQINTLLGKLKSKL